MIFLVLGILCLLNATFVIYTVIINCQDKKRLKAREKRRVVWDAAWKQVQLKRPSRFSKPREYDS